MKTSYLGSQARRLVEVVLRSSSPILVLGHKNSDPDAVASAIVIRNFIEHSLGRRAIVSFPDGVNEVSKKIIGKLGLSSLVLDHVVALKSSIKLMFRDVVLVVDTSSYEQLGGFLEVARSARHIVRIDHHSSTDIVGGHVVSIYDRESRSTSEIVYLLLRSLGYRLEPIEAVLLLTGIVYDTRRFMYASPRTFSIASELLSVGGVDYRRVLDLLQTEMDLSERIARLKAAKRLVLRRVGEFIIVYTHVSAFEGSVARALLELGADIAIVGSSNKETRIVIRARPSVAKRLGVNLGRDIMPAIGEYLGGGGGGHETAGAASGRADLQRALRYAYKLVSSLIEERAKDMK